MYMSDNDLVFTLRAVADSQAGSQAFANDLGNAMKAINASVMQVSQAVQQQTQFLQQNAATQQAVTQATQTTASAVVDYTSKVDKLRASLDPAVKASQTLSAQTDLLQKALSAGNITNTEYTALITKAEAAHKAAADAAHKHGGTIDSLGMSLGETLRHLRALGDEAAAGRWKSFDGSLINILAHIGAANGEMVALLVPFIAAGAAAVAFAAGAALGTAEQLKFNNALIMTGNFAGQTLDSMRGMQEVFQQSGGNVGTFKEALLELAASGKFTGDNINYIATVASKLEETAGVPVANTIKQFEELGKSPVEASVKLNDQYHYLTLAVFEQIEALVKQGDQIGAAKLAQDAFADATKERTTEMEANVGLLIGVWRSLKNEISGATDAVMNFGKTETLQSKMQTLQDQIDNNNKSVGQQYSDSGPVGMLKGLFAGSQSDADKTNAPLYAQQAALEKQMMSQSEAAYAQSQKKQRDEQSITDELFLKGIDIKINRFDKFYEVTNKINAAFERQRALFPNDAHYSQQAQDEADADAYKKYGPKDKKGKKAPSQNGLINGGINDELKGPADDLKNNNDDFKNAMQEQTQLYSTHQITIEQFYANASEAIDAHTARMADDYAQQHDMLTADLQRTDINAQERQRIGQKLIDLQQAQIKMDQDYAHEVDKNTTTRSAALKKESDSIAAYADSMQKANNLAQQAADGKVAQVGEGSAQYAQQQAMLALQKDYETQMAQLNTAHEKDTPGDNTVYDAKVAALRESVNERVRIEQDGYTRMKAAQGDWENGVTQAYQNFQTTADNTAAQVGTAFNTFTNGLTTDLVNFAMTGKTSFSGLATSVIKDMLKMEIQAAESKIFGLIQTMVGSIGGIGGEQVAMPISATSGVTSTPIAHSGDIAGMNSTMRGVNSSLFAGASRYHSGGIVDGEVPIIAQKGEAVMPTVRMSDGTLGIKAAGGGAGSGTTNVVQVPVTLNVQYSGQGGGQSNNPSDHKAFANSLTDQLTNVMDDRINKWAADQTRPGGALSGAQKNRMGG